MSSQIPNVETKYKGSPNKAIRGNVFDSSAATKRRLRSFMKMYEITSYMHLARLLGVRGGATVWGWMNTTTRPNARFTSRLLELSMWVHDHGLVLKDVEYVDWEVPMIVMRGNRGEPRRYLSVRDWEYISDSQEQEGHGPTRLRP